MPTLIRFCMGLDSSTAACAYDDGIGAPAAKTSRPPVGGPGLLSLGELLAAPCLVQAHLFALDFASVARHQSRFGQRRLELTIVVDQRAGDAVPYRAGLTRFSAAVYVHHDVEGRFVVGYLQWLTHHHATGFAREKLVDRLFIHHELARPLLDENACHGAFAPARTIVIISDHEREGSRFRGSWVAAPRAGASARRSI